MVELLDEAFLHEAIVLYSSQHEGVSRVDRHFRESSLMPRLDDTAKVLFRSQSGPMFGAGLLRQRIHTRIESHFFPFRRLRMPFTTLCSLVVVAAPWILLATIEQRVHGRVCLHRVASRWRSLRQKCAFGCATASA